MIDHLRPIYLAVNTEAEVTDLRCSDHPDWWGDGDGELPDVIRRANAHLYDAHRVHVDGCMCRDRVTDGRCLPAGVS